MMRWKDKAAGLSIPRLVDYIWEAKTANAGIRVILHELRERVADIAPGATLEGHQHRLLCKRFDRARVVDREAAVAHLKRLGLFEALSTPDASKITAAIRRDMDLWVQLGGAVDYREVVEFHLTGESGGA